MGQEMRLDKFLVSTGEFTRTTAKAAIRRGRVCVDGTPAARPEQKLDPACSTVTLDGAPVAYQEFYYFMMNKPAGYLSATEDRRDATVLDLLPPKYRKIGLFPAGRLDKDAEGFLLLTNDGALAHGLMAPGRHVKKVYEATLDRALEPADIAAFREGVIIDGDYVCMPAELEIVPGHAGKLGRVSVMEGRFHQVKKMFLARNKCVIYLKRIEIGTVKLDFSLQSGAFRELNKLEIKRLCDAAGRK